MTGTFYSKKMLYCPKCQRTYEESAQRFCDYDGGRLLPAPNSPKAQNKQNGIFTNLVGKSPQKQEQDEKLAAIPRFSPAEFNSIYAERKTIEDEPEVELELFPAPKREIVNKPLPKPVQPLARVIRQSEIPSGTASVGNRQTNPTGRQALTAENPSVLLGQTIKGRYYIVELLGQDESGIDYLAEDKITPPKKYTVRVLTKESGADDLMESIYAEERVWLSHVNHPNVARVVDSGELLEGKQFIISEYNGADSVKNLLDESKQLNALRTARIIRQAANALSEVHENGILHRDLKPENIVLTINETGAEQIKLNGFGISDGYPNAKSRGYKSPEVLEGKLATVAGDVFSLAAIAYQMLSDRLPFGAAGEKEILKLQREGSIVSLSDLRPDISSAACEVLEKAMSFNARDRYPKARDFGDAFFNAVSASVDAKKDEPETAEEIEIAPMPDEPEQIIPAKTDLNKNFDDLTVDDEARNKFAETEFAPVTSDIQIKPQIDDDEIERREISEIETKTAKSETENPAWTRRSPEPPKKATLSWMIFSLLGVALLLAAAWAIWSYGVKRQNQIDAAAQKASQAAETNPVEAATPQVPKEISLDIEVPPMARQIKQPPNTTYFQNSKQSVKGDLIRNFLGFSLYYPNDWKINEAKEASKQGTRGKFLDLSKNNADGNLVEQMLVSYYESKGTFKDDTPKFSQLVRETNETLTKLIPGYQVLSEGATTINGWNAYEIKFQGGGTTGKGEKMIIWGRRLFIPVVRAGAQSGYEITMLATSQADKVKSVDDVGNSDELSAILQTFEPNQSY